MVTSIEKLERLCRLVRYNILASTTKAGSGHPTSSLSAVELMTAVFFAGFFSADDRVIFSKGHAAPLLYSLYQVAGQISFEELMTLRQFDSRLEGHPTPNFPFVEVATGSLGQGLSVGCGMALGIKLRQKNDGIKMPCVFVLLGDSEMAEGQNWEALQIAAKYRLDNLIAILDVNRLGQRGETMLGWDTKSYEKRAAVFGWRTIMLEDGHDLKKIVAALGDATKGVNKEAKPTMIIAKTVKGKGVSFLENQNGWHGKSLDQEQFARAVGELGDIDRNLKVDLRLENNVLHDLRNIISGMKNVKDNQPEKIYDQQINYATREAYGDALLALGEKNENIVVFDAETSNSTYADKFAKKISGRFFEMYIAEQNMISSALGISKMGFVPFVSTFAAFLTRGFDQIRMSQYSTPNLKICGSHAGVSIGQDGASQMGLEDIAMFRSVLESVIFYPADATSCYNLTRLAAQNYGLFYLRTTRGKLPIVYKPNTEFKIGGLHVLRQSKKSKILVIAAGITLHEALKAHDKLQEEGINITVVDLYCIKPLDSDSLKRLSESHEKIIVVEDHYPAGGMGEAILSELGRFNIKSQKRFIHLCVKKIPRSGKPEELLAFEEIDAQAIIQAAKKSV